MAKIEPNQLYSMQDLEDLVGDLMSVEAFLRTIEPRRPFKKCFWGKHLIEALDSCGKDVRGNLHR
ncbi:MAG: hypothetical protein KC964_28940, partial [Candidatus Omnitrophica bacterium]|nr:hypothetical protein [Candidatus Omnitrophota bacterium]